MLLIALRELRRGKKPRTRTCNGAGGSVGNNHLAMPLAFVRVVAFAEDHASVVVLATPVGPGTVVTPPQPPMQEVTVMVEVVMVVTIAVVPC